MGRRCATGRRAARRHGRDAGARRRDGIGPRNSRRLRALDHGRAPETARCGARRRAAAPRAHLRRDVLGDHVTCYSTCGGHRRGVVQDDDLCRDPSVASSRFPHERTGSGDSGGSGAVRSARRDSFGAFDLRRGRRGAVGVRERRRAVSRRDGGRARRNNGPARLLRPRRRAGPRLELHVARVDVGSRCRGARGRRHELRRDRADPYRERVLHL
mmetsp:Transcript_10546/g.27901  ORF Transcript_10546/g.27901 Transcript_10546/m.27901 type:complete len:214 (+) Transcript_10546:707-1348(+)